MFQFLRKSLLQGAEGGIIKNNIFLYKAQILLGDIINLN